MRKASELALYEVTLGRADAVLERYLSDTDHLDLKAMHLAVVDIAAFSILVVLHRGVLWPIPAVLLAAAGMLFWGVFRPRSWDYGPDLAAFRSEQKGRTRPEITRAMLDDVIAGTDINAPRLTRKAAYFTWGYRILGAGLISSFILAFLN
jgi:hypothetical protein